MKALFHSLIVCSLFAFLPGMAIASDQDDATRAAKEILVSLHAKQFEKLWNTQTSPYFSKNLTKDSFLANLTMGRAQIGSLVESKFIDMSYSQIDPATGFKGEIYGFNFLTTYSSGKFYERVVVVKDTDGKFRLAGLWGTAASK